MSAQIPVWLDVDTGVDDAHALLLAARSPALELVGVSCVSGNVDVDTVVAATAKVLDAAGCRLDLPFTRGADRPLIEPRHECPQIHGTDGLGDLEPPLKASPRAVSAETAPYELFLRTLREREEPLVLVALAPLTNVATCIRLAPALCREKIARIVWMGGATSVGGNATAWAEANARYDPEAAHIVLTSGIEIMMYTWDVYLKVEHTKEEVLSAGVPLPLLLHGSKSGGSGDGMQRNNGNVNGKPPWTELSARLLYRDMVQFGAESAQIGDGGAVAAIINPEAVTTKHMHVAVELDGKHTRGMTVVDQREFVFPPDKEMEPANVHVVVQVDGDALKRVYNEAVLFSDGGSGGSGAEV